MSQSLNVSHAASTPVALLVDSSAWACSARLGLRLSKLGARVVGICLTHGHPLPGTRGVTTVYGYPLCDAAEALVAHIEREKPDLIVAFDERSRRDLQLAHALACAGEKTFVASRIEQSLGSPHSFQTALSRVELLTVAEEEGVRAAPSRAISDEEALAEWCEHHPFPIVLKRDGTSGGRGVAIVSTPREALRAFRRLSSPLSLAHALGRRYLRSDRFSVGRWRDAEFYQVSAQTFIPGRPGNCAVACWEGEVLAFLAVECLHTVGPTGAATVVRLIEGAEMRRAAERIVRRLGLSGFCGFDFIIDSGTEAPWLIEMNPRATTLCPLAAGPRRDLVAALLSAVTGKPLTAGSELGESRVVAYFPSAWQLGAPTELLRVSHHDIPHEDPDLVRRLCKAPPHSAHKLNLWTSSRSLPGALDPERFLAPVRDQQSKPSGSLGLSARAIRHIRPSTPALRS